MKLSIITVNLNNKTGLEKTVKSVCSQTFEEFEFIIIDGGSTDGSLDIIKRYEDNISCWVSEQDKGVYNAMNKGIKMAKGEYLQFLNSGDSLINSDVLNKVFKENKTEDIIYGNLMIGKKFLKSPPVLSFLVFFNDTINHQASFIKKALFEKYGLYREDLKIVSDWEFFMKTILFENCTHKYIDILIVSYEGGGISSDVILFNEERNGILKNFFPILHADFDHISRLVKYENSRLFKPVITFYEYKFIKKILFLFKSSLSSHK